MDYIVDGAHIKQLIYYARNVGSSTLSFYVGQSQAAGSIWWMESEPTLGEPKCLLGIKPMGPFINYKYGVGYLSWFKRKQFFRNPVIPAPKQACFGQNIPIPSFFHRILPRMLYIQFLLIPFAASQFLPKFFPVLS